MNDIIVDVKNVGKKFSKDLKHVMLYGVEDVMSNIVGMAVKSEKLRSGEFWAIEETSFQLKKGETLGIIGPNGSGKSTLLKMLNGIYMPDRGSIEIKGRVGALIQVGAGFHPMLTGRENIYVNGSILGMSKKEIDKHFASIIDFADIEDFLDVPIKNYSTGMHVRLGFAIAIHCQPDILLVDEVLAVGDAGFQTKCLNEIGRLRDNGTSTIIISHNMHLIQTYTERVILMNKGKTSLTENVSDGVNAYNKLFVSDSGERGIEKQCNGNESIHFLDAQIPNRILNPLDDFSITLEYESSIDYDDVDIDFTIVTDTHPTKYFQATNKAYNQSISLKKGRHAITCDIKGIALTNRIATIGFSIWTKDRTEHLFWWRIPIEFKSVEHSSGNNFYTIEYKHH